MKKVFAILLLGIGIVMTSCRQVEAQSITINADNAIRIIGVASAVAGVTALAHKKGSKFWGLFLVVTGTVATIGADEIMRATQRNWLEDLKADFDSLCKNF